MGILKFYIILLLIGMSTNLPSIIKTGTLTNTTINTATNVNTLSPDRVEAYKDDLAFLFKTLESNHPNLYHKNDKAVFDKKLAEIERTLDTMSDMEFAIALSELTALVGDSHTRISTDYMQDENTHRLPISVTMVEEGLLVNGILDEHKQVLGGILTSINGLSMDDIKQKLKPIISFDNEVYLYKQFVDIFYIYEILEHYGVLSSPENIVLEIKLGDQIETIKVDAMDKKTMKTKKFSTINNLSKTAYASELYFFKPLDKETLYIQYNACREDATLPMEMFAHQVKDAMTKNEYKRTILDLRYNGGGSDRVITPLMDVLDEKCKQEGMQLYTLIGSLTFSAATNNAVMLKQIGSTIVGTPTGGSVKHFGEISKFELPNSKITGQYSNKLIDLPTLIDAAKTYEVEPFLPDIFAEQNCEDYLLGKDTAVEAILSDTKK